jgi:glyoxylase-like metal-dependent hydrolase (beta-lactamase superfamily II)
MAETTDYSIWALECAVIDEYPDPALLYGAMSGSRILPFVYWVVQGNGRTILIDTGFNENEWSLERFEHYGVKKFKTPDQILSRIGLTPEDIDTVIITHHHFDHVSGVRYFPNAQVFIQNIEVENWYAKMAVPERISWLQGGLDPETGADLAKIAVEGRLRLVNGLADVAPGIQVRPAFNTHTMGSQYVTVAQSEGAPWVFSGDVCYCFDNIGGVDGHGPHVPVGIAQGSQESILRSTDEMVTVAGNQNSRIIPSHEVLTWSLFPSKVFDDGLHMAEIALAPREASRL